jgi:starch synthase
LGTVDAKYQKSFLDMSKAYPKKIGVFLAYDYELAHKIFAGADALLVPSRYEPCGLNQLYGLKYGTVPIVRSTGGLIDTVEPFNPEKDSGTGFLFSDPEPGVLTETILTALATFVANPTAWKSLMVRGMMRDFSWGRSAEKYLSLYEKAIAQRKAFLNKPPAA